MSEKRIGESCEFEAEPEDVYDLLRFRGSSHRDMYLWDEEGTGFDCLFRSQEEVKGSLRIGLLIWLYRGPMVEFRRENPGRYIADWTDADLDQYNAARRSAHTEWLVKSRGEVFARIQIARSRYRHCRATLWFDPELVAIAPQPPTKGGYDKNLLDALLAANASLPTPLPASDFSNVNLKGLQEFFERTRLENLRIQIRNKIEEFLEVLWLDLTQEVSETIAQRHSLNEERSALLRGHHPRNQKRNLTDTGRFLHA